MCHLAAVSPQGHGHPVAVSFRGRVSPQPCHPMAVSPHSRVTPRPCHPTAWPWQGAEPGDGPWPHGRAEHGSAGPAAPVALPAPAACTGSTHSRSGMHMCVQRARLCAGTCVSAGHAHAGMGAAGAAGASPGDELTAPARSHQADAREQLAGSHLRAPRCRLSPHHCVQSRAVRPHQTPLPLQPARAQSGPHSLSPSPAPLHPTGPPRAGMSVLARRKGLRPPGSSPVPAVQASPPAPLSPLGAGQLRDTEFPGAAPSPWPLGCCPPASSTTPSCPMPAPPGQLIVGGSISLAGSVWRHRRPPHGRFCGGRRCRRRARCHRQPHVLPVPTAPRSHTARPAGTTVGTASPPTPLAQAPCRGHADTYMWTDIGTCTHRSLGLRGTACRCRSTHSRRTHVCPPASTHRGSLGTTDPCPAGIGPQRGCPGSAASGQ